MQIDLSGYYCLVFTGNLWLQLSFSAVYSRWEQVGGTEKEFTIRMVFGKPKLTWSWYLQGIKVNKKNFYDFASSED